jgi:nitroreductase
MITSAIHTRRSIRRYVNRPVQPDLIDQLLNAARRAPSSHNCQLGALRWSLVDDQA